MGKLITGLQNKKGKFFRVGKSSIKMIDHNIKEQCYFTETYLVQHL